MSTPVGYISAAPSRTAIVTKWAFRIFLILMSLWLFVVFLQIRGIVWVYASVADWLNQNLNLADEFSVLLAALLTAAALPLISYFVSFLFLARHRLKVTLFALGATGVATGLLLAFGQDVFFLPDGTPLRCYVTTAEGIKIARRQPTAQCPIDKTYSIKYEPMTREIVHGILAARRGVRPKPIDPENFDGTYFDAVTSRALVWYRERPDGTFDLFDGAGFHPQTGQPLAPALNTEQRQLEAIDAFVKIRKQQAADRRAAEEKAAAEQLAREALARAEAESRRVAEEQAAAKAAEEERIRQERELANQGDLEAAAQHLASGNLLGARNQLDSVLARTPKHSQARSLYSQWNLEYVCSTCGAVVSVEEVEIDGKRSNAALVGGAAVGGVAGHQAGKGRGKDAATAAGVAVGAIAADKLWRWATSKTAFVVVLQIDDGQRQGITLPNRPALSVGQRVIITTDINSGAPILAAHQ